MNKTFDFWRNKKIILGGLKMKKYYPGIDLFKFIFSLLVVCIHVNPLADVNYTANLIVSK